MDIRQIRAKYPQYSDLSDKQLADALHTKFYSDLPIQDYYKRIGLTAEPTITGQAKELVKGLIPGAVGLVEQAAIGASALLPEDYEKGAREGIAKVAGAVKAPFAAAPGYEESVGRKLSEAIGSTAPFLLAGPLGWAGRAAAVGLGVGAGAGEARTRAEKEGATAEQRATATALGVLPGAAEVFAPFRILSRIPDAATAQGVQLVKRALLAGGEEAAQEAASGFAQNLIAKGVYKPEQELIEGLGEQAAYGGATGAIVQGLMDLAIGRRARGATAPPTGEAPIDTAARGAQPPAAAPATAPAAAPAGIPPLPDTYAELVLYGEQIKQLPKSKERDAALQAAREKREAIIAEEVSQNRLTAEKAKEFLSAEEAAAAEIQRRDELETEATAPAPAPIPEPTVVEKGAPPSTGMQPPDIEALGISKKQPIYRRMLGKDMNDPVQRDAVLADIENYLVRGNGSEESRAKLTEFKERFAPAPTPTAPPVPTEIPSDTAVVEPASGAGVPVAGEPGAGAAPGGTGVAEPSGVVPPVADVGKPAAGEGAEPGAVTPDYTKFNYEQLEGMLNNANQINLDLDLASIRKHMGDEAAAAYQAMTPRQRDKWWIANATTEMEEDGSPFKGVNEETIRDFMNAQFAFDTESPELLGRSVALVVRNINEPGFTTSPEFVTLRNALAYAKEQGWSEKDVLNAMRSRAAEWAGDDAQELFKDLFKPKVERPAVPPAPPALAAPAAAAPAPAPAPPTEAPAAPLATFPPVSDITNFRIGPGETIKPKVIAPNQPLYRETNKGGLDDLLRLDEQAEYGRLFVTDDRDLALGQGENKGVIVTFRPNSLSGTENVKPGTGIAGGREYQTDLIAPRSVMGVELSPTDYKTLRPATRRVLSGFVRSELPSGNLLFVRKGFEDQVTASSTPAPAPAPAPAPKKVLKGSVENQVKALGINAAQGGVPDLKVIREAVEPIDPKMARAVLFYLGVDYDGNLLVGANNLPQTPSAQEAGDMAGLGKNSGDRVKKVAKALDITGDIRRKYLASQTDRAVAGAASESSESRAAVESRASGVLTEQSWYKPIAEKTLKGANHTELARAVLLGQRYLGTTKENEAALMELMGEVEARAKRPEFAAAFKRQQGLLAPDQTGISRKGENEAALLSESEYEEGTPGTEEAVDDRGEGDRGEDNAQYRTVPGTPVITNRATNAELEKVVSDIEKSLGGKVEVTILDDVTDIDAKQKSGSRAGATVKGGIYLFRSGIAKGIEGQKTVFHELFHRGLRNLLPDAEYRALMSRFYNQSAEIRAMADAYLASDTGKQDTKDLSPQDARVLAVEESLAEVAEQTKLKPTLVRQVGNFLARVADRLGMPQLARAIRTMGLNEQQKFIQDALRAGMGASKVDEGASRFRTAITPESEAAAKELDAIGERKQDRFRDKVGRQLKGNAALRLREKLTDSMAPMEDFFVKAYGGQIRTAAGRLNPMPLLSRALDSGRVSKAAQVEGGLARKDGLIVAAELKNDKGESVSYQKVLERIADTAKAQNKDPKAYRTTIDNILYGHREHGLREKNREIEQQAQALEAAGKTEKANTLRGDKIELMLDDAQIDRAEAAFQNDAFIKGVLGDLDTIRFNMLDMLVDTGRLSKEQAQDYKDAIGYIPFERIGEYENKWTGAGRGANRGAAALKNRRDLEGSTRQSTSVIENFSGLMDWGTKEAMKNEAARRALEDMELLGAAKRRDKKPKEDSPGGIEKVFVDGEPVNYYIPDPAHLATFSLADPQLSNIVKGLSLATRTLRAGVTSMPPFAIKQVFDDIVRAYAYAGVKNNGELVRNVLFNFPKNWFNEVFKRKTDSVRDLERLGIVGTFDFTQHTNLKDILRESGMEKEGLAHKILRVMEAGAKASDISVREAVYKQVMKETGDAAQAESAAREIINFSRRGSSRAMNMMISIIPFFNAYARGMDKLATAAAGGVVGKTTGTARSMFYKRMTVLTGMGLAYALLMSDDEDYEALPDHVRDTNWILPYGKELGFTPAIPIPAELAFFFKAIPERVLRYYKYQGTEDEQAAVQVLGELARRGYDVFSSPNLMAQGIRPLVENLVNYSFFLGRPLESAAQLKLRPFERYGTGTSDAMKALAGVMEDAANATGIETFAISPIKLENAMRGIFGTAAGVALSMADMMINPNRTDRPLHQQLTSQVTGASALMKGAVGTRYMDAIYDLESRVEQVNGTYNRLVQSNPEKVDEYIRDNIGLFSIRGPMQSIMDGIRTLNDAARTIDRDTTLSPQERRQRVDELRVQQNEMARQVYALGNLARDIQRGL